MSASEHIRSVPPVVRVLAGAVMISFAPVLVRVVEVPPTASAFYRMLIGGLVLLAWTRLRRLRLGMPRPALVALIVAGAAFAADLGLWHRSIWYVGPGLATLLANCQVFALAAAGVALFGERLGWRLCVAIPLAITGLGLIVAPGWSGVDADYRLGVLFGLATAIAYAIYILALRHARVADPEAQPARDLAISSLISAAALGALAAVEGIPMLPPSGADLGLLALYGLVAQVFGWMLISSALGQVPASRVGLILLLQPALAFVWDVLFFARPLSAIDVTGATLALAAIYLGSRAASPPPPPRPEEQPRPGPAKAC